MLFFAATDCPLANRYLPTVAALRAHFQSSGVRFLDVFPNPSDTREVVSTHDLQFPAAGQSILDPRQTLVQLAGARMTPEAAVFVPEAGHWREVYLGRIDDRYLSLGRERPAPTRHDLEAALRAVLAHQPVTPPGGPSVGCAIMPLTQ